MSGMFRRLGGSLRQLRFPLEFRIPESEGEGALLEDAGQLVRELLAASQVPRAEGTRSSEPEQERFLARLATGLWRLRQRMIDPAAAEPNEEIRRAYRHFQAVWDTLSEFGVEVRDHTGERFDSGLALSVLSYEQDSTLSREVVKETVKPAVYLRDRCIQRAEVIVGTPKA